MADLAIGAKAPDSNISLASGETLSVSSLRGRIVVVFFYPRAGSPACTDEVKSFSGLHQAFADTDAEVVGISPDTARKLSNFASKQNVAVQLGSDPDTELAKQWGVWVEKSMYGRQFMGVERATFVIGRNQRIAGIWRKVSVPGHAQEVLAFVQKLGA